MPEMIIPGTYIEVRAEGLIRPGPVSTGNVGIVGTARRGRLNRIVDGRSEPVVYTPANIGDAREIFGDADAFGNQAAGVRELTLIRALELVFANGGQRVFAVRVAEAAAASTVHHLPADTNALVFTSVAPGSGYDEATIQTGAISNNVVDVTITLDTIVESWRSVPADVEQFSAVLNGSHISYNYNVNASTGGGSNLFTVAVGAATGNVSADQPPDGAPDPSPQLQTPGTDGATPIAAEYTERLNALVNQNVQIVVLAGQDAQDLGAALVSHVENASSDLIRRERIGVIGTASNASAQAILGERIASDEGRMVYVGPGLKIDDSTSGREVSLPGTYTAAAVAGRISSLDPHASPTNKTINAKGLAIEFNGTELEQLLLGPMLPLEDRNGAIRIVRGLAAISENTAWSQITTRRIVDFARKGVRAAANPFIGKLNNERVRAALKGSINSFMADMVDREMLISYELDVSATRDQEVRGIAQVTMVVRPTFSIDFVRVVMYLE